METEISPEELSAKDGKDGRPAWVSLQGKVYDVSGSKLWAGGTHMRRHQAGRVLDKEMSSAPHGTEVLDRVSRAGLLKEEKETKAQPENILERWTAAWPSLRRHPHPASAHFPVALFLAAAFFALLGKAGGGESFGTTSFHCFVAALVSTPLTIATGYMTWRINYGARRMGLIIAKMRLAWALLIIAALAIILPSLYLPLSLLSAVLAGVTGYLGGRLTIPD